MKLLLTASVALCAVAILAQARSEEAKGARQYPKYEKLYEAVVSDRTIAIFYSLEPFNPAKHKITRTKFDGYLDRIAVDGKTLVGSWDETELKEGVPSLTSLHVMFGDVRVDVPPEILQPLSVPTLLRLCLTLNTRCRFNQESHHASWKPISFPI